MSRIKPGQVYESCDPRDSIRIRVVSVAVDSPDVQVVDVAMPTYSRTVPRSALNGSGRDRYRLIQDA